MMKCHKTKLMNHQWIMKVGKNLRADRSTAASISAGCRFISSISAGIVAEADVERVDRYRYVINGLLSAGTCMN